MHQGRSESRLQLRDIQKHPGFPKGLESDVIPYWKLTQHFLSAFAEAIPESNMLILTVLPCFYVQPAYAFPKWKN